MKSAGEARLNDIANFLIVVASPVVGDISQI